MTYVDRLSACCLHEFSYALFVFMLKGKKSRKNTKKFDQNELKPRAMLEVQHQIGMGFFSLHIISQFEPQFKPFATMFSLF